MAEGSMKGTAPIMASESLRLQYNAPASHWVEALPIGNGRLGAMVFGGAPSERFQLNEESLWSGFPRDCDNPDAINHLSQVRKAVFDGDYPAGRCALQEDARTV